MVWEHKLAAALIWMLVRKTVRDTINEIKHKSLLQLQIAFSEAASWAMIHKLKMFKINNKHLAFSWIALVHRDSVPTLGLKRITKCISSRIKWDWWIKEQGKSLENKEYNQALTKEHQWAIKLLTDLLQISINIYIQMDPKEIKDNKQDLM